MSCDKNSTEPIFFQNNSTQNNDVDTITPWRTKVKHFFSLITVEPSMFFYMMAFMVTSVVEQSFFVYKACIVDAGYPESICRNLTGNSTENKNVQVIVSTFHQYNDIASQAIPIVLALFIGAWSDRRGRKLLLILGLLGKLWYSTFIVINSIQNTWTLNTVIWTASLPSGLTGADVAIFAACFSYLSDITTQEDRTLRVTILDVVYLVAIPVGVALGNFLFYSVFNQSYTKMFIINVTLLVASLLYSLLRLESTTTPAQVSLTWASCCGSVKENIITDFFDYQHFLSSVKTIARKRPNHGRLFVILLIFSLGLYTFQRDERQMSYLYTINAFNWNAGNFSNFRTFQSGFFVLGTLLCLPLMTKLLRLRDATIIVIGTLSHAIARVIYALATDPKLFYVGGVISMAGPVVAPVIRAMASKIVPVKERGKMFAVLSVADTAVPLFSGIVYTQVYNATIHTYPSAIYWITVTTQLAVGLAAILIQILSKGRLEDCLIES